MLEIPGYKITREVRATTTSSVYFGIRERDRLSVVLKLYHQSRPARTAGGEAAAASVRARHEYEVLRRLDVPGVIKAIGLERYQDNDVLVMERFPGISLWEYIRTRDELDLEACLHIMHRITLSLVPVHAARIVHGDLKPANILIDPIPLDVALVDFGLSRELGQVRRLEPPQSLCGSLRYLSPEQTGRTRHGVDFRSDLYSLGIVFYMLLTGRAPFRGKTALALIHAHIGLVPIPPREVEPSTPAALSEIVMKLLEKEPDARYQSAYGLARDLESCLSKLTSKGRIPDGLELGTHDSLDRLRFTDRVVGKQTEIEELERALDRTAVGPVELLAISGAAGIGKSALCSVLDRAASARGAYVGRWKFEADQQRVPYAGLSGVVSSLIEQILVERADRFELWSQTLQHSLGGVGGALLSLAPDLALVVGELPVLPPVGPVEARDRLMLAIRRFLSAFTQVGSQLVLIWDDVHWADEGSLSLIRGLTKDQKQLHALVVVSARCDLGGGALVEGASSGCEARAESEAPAEWELLLRAAQSSIRVSDLTPSEVNEMIADILGAKPETTRELSEWVGIKACRNPLQVQRVLELMWERGSLAFEHGSGWRWDLEQLASLELSSDSATWMAEKLEHLSDPHRKLLTVASIQSGAFDLDALQAVHGSDRETLLQALTELVESGVILLCRDGFKFSHERIREAAQRLVSVDQRTYLHFSVGRVLLEKLGARDVSASLFLAAEHLRQGWDHVSEELRIDVVKLQLRAGREALAEGASKQASEFLISGTKLFRPEDWDHHRDVGFELYLQFAQAAMQLDQFARVHAILNDLEGRHPNRIEYARVCAQRVQVLSLTQNLEVCARYALSVLAELGANWPLYPSRLQTWISCLRLRLALRGRRSEHLFPQPSGHLDQDLVAILIVLNIAGHILARIDVRLVLLSSSFILEKYSRVGCIRSPSMSLAAFGWAEHALFPDAHRLRLQAQRVEDWNERIPDPLLGIAGRLQLFTQMHPWIMGRRKALAGVEDVAEAMSEVGLREGMYYALFLDAYLRVLAGDPVSVSRHRMLDLVKRIESAGHQYVAPDGCAIILGYLVGPRMGDGDFECAVEDLDEWIASHPGSSDTRCRTLMLMTLCVYGRYELAFEQSEAAGEMLYRVVPDVHVADHVLYRGIAAAEIAIRAGRFRALRQCWALFDALRRMRRWARGGPDFLHMLWILRAKRAELFGHLERADLLISKAAELARKQGYLNHVAIALEQRARLLRRQNRMVASEAALRDAIHAYEYWGARTKALELRAQL